MGVIGGVERLFANEGEERKERVFLSLLGVGFKI
jgi:hypothetical protein